MKHLLFQSHLHCEKLQETTLTITQIPVIEIQNSVKKLDDTHSHHLVHQCT